VRALVEVWFERRAADDQVLYELTGLVSHSGSMSGGHYVAYVKVRPPRDRDAAPAPGQWHYVSDSFARRVDQADVLAEQAYLLFYERLP